ncbi:MAG: hypothetical protein AAGE52_17880 [Myxococcota bacterium]
MRATALLAVLAACTFRVPVEPMAIDLESLRMGETDFSELIRAVDRIQLAGRAELLPGRYSLTAENYAAMEVSAPTLVTFEADVSIAAETRREKLEVTPAVRTFAVRFDRAIILHGRTDSRRVSLEGASVLDEDRQNYDVDVRVGRSLMGTIASAVVGVPAGMENAPSALEMLKRVEVDELTTALRPGSVIHHGESELHVIEGSNLVLSHIDVNLAQGSAHLNADGTLRLGEGTRIVSEDAHLLVASANLEVHGDYQWIRDGEASTQRLRLSQLDQPSILRVEQAKLQWEDGAEAIETAHGAIELERYECAGADADRCAYVAKLNLDTGPGSLVLEGHPLRFEGLAIQNARLTRTDDEGAIQIERITVDRPKVQAATEGVLLGFSEIALEGLQGTRFESLTMASGSVIARAGAVDLTLGNTQITAQVPGETTLRLSQRDQIVLGRTSETIPDLGVRAAVDNVTIAVDGSPFAEATGLEIDATLGETSTAELRLREAIRIDADAVANLAIGNVRLDFRTIRVEHSDALTHLRTEGLRLSLPQQNVLAMLQLHVPPSFVGDEQPLEGSLERILSQAASTLDMGQLSRFRTRLEAGGLDALNMSFDRGRLRLRGNVDATLRLLADERQVHVRQCTHTVEGTLPVPCFEDSLPAICERPVSVEVPYPCVEEEDVDAEVLHKTLRLRMDVSGEVTSNAPASLGELELTARVARCDRVDIAGIDNRLERLLDIEGLICERLQEVTQTMALGEVLDVEGSPLLAGARVERLDIDSDETDLHIGLDLDVRLQAPTVTAE